MKTNDLKHGFITGRIEKPKKKNPDKLLSLAIFRWENFK